MRSRRPLPLPAAPCLLHAAHLTRLHACACTQAKEQLTAEAKARESQAASAAASQAGPSTAGSQALGTGLGGGGGASQRGGCLAWSGPLPTDAQKREIILADP